MRIRIVHVGFNLGWCMSIKIVHAGFNLGWCMCIRIVHVGFNLGWCMSIRIVHVGLNCTSTYLVRTKIDRVSIPLCVFRTHTTFVMLQSKRLFFYIIILIIFS